MDELSFSFLINKFKYKNTDFKQGLQLTLAPLGIKIRIGKKHLIKRFNTAIGEMREDNTIEQIVKKYSDIPNDYND